MMNKEPLLKQMDIFADEFLKMRNLIADDEVEQLREKMRLSTQRRQLFDRK